MYESHSDERACLEVYAELLLDAIGNLGFRSEIEGFDLISFL
jgi:hypothetical protein